MTACPTTEAIACLRRGAMRLPEGLAEQLNVLAASLPESDDVLGDIDEMTEDFRAHVRAASSSRPVPAALAAFSAHELSSCWNILQAAGWAHVKASAARHTAEAFIEALRDIATPMGRLF